MSDQKDRTGRHADPDPLGDPLHPWRAAVAAASQKAHAVGAQLNAAVIAAFDPPHDFLPAEERAAMLFESRESAKALEDMIAEAERLYEEALEARGPRLGDHIGLDEDWTVKGLNRAPVSMRSSQPFVCARCGWWIVGPGVIETDDETNDHPETWHEDCFAQERITDIHRTAEGNWAFSLPEHLGEKLMAVRFTGVRLGDRVQSDGSK